MTRVLAALHDASDALLALAREIEQARTVAKPIARLLRNAADRIDPRSVPAPFHGDGPQTRFARRAVAEMKGLGALRRAFGAERLPDPKA